MAEKCPFYKLTESEDLNGEVVDADIKELLNCKKTLMVSIDGAVNATRSIQDSFAQLCRAHGTSHTSGICTKKGCKAKTLRDLARAVEVAFSGNHMRGKIRDVSGHGEEKCPLFELAENILPKTEIVNARKIEGLLTCKDNLKISIDGVLNVAKRIIELHYQCCTRISVDRSCELHRLYALAEAVENALTDHTMRMKKRDVFGHSKKNC